jgi:serine/threonine protein kinase/Flp pilus assembly protein TadD
LVGKTVSHYQVVGELVPVGEGEVYLAEDTRLGRQVALRFLPASFQYDLERKTSFLAEARAASGLRSAHVAAIYDIGEHEGALFVVMEYVEGQRLSWKLDSGPLAVSEAVQVAAQIADALSEAHSIGISHTNLQSSSMILTERGIVKLLDLGLGRGPIREPASGREGTQPLGRQTAVGVGSASVAYMSPEEARYGSADQRSDLFSLGVVLYEMLTATLPFTGGSTTELIDKIVHQTPEPISRLNYNVPPELDRIVGKCLEKDPQRRYQSARELLTDLRNLQRDLESVQQASRPAIGARQTQSIARGRGRKTIDSIAVLPIENQSGDPEVEYLCDGLTEALIGNLSEISRLRVMARSTVFRFKGRPSTDALEIGRELGVKAVLTGRLLQRGDELLIRLELVDTVDGSHLWGHSYNRKLDDIMRVEEEISHDISEKLRLRLTGSLKKQAARRYTENTEAYQLYLKGRYHWNKRTEEGIRRSVEHFEKAIETDPGYALAYAGLADAYNMLASYSTAPLATPFLRAKATALMALRLDDRLAEAHCALAAVKFWRDWDWSGAERGFDRAVELNPAYATAQMWRSLFLAGMRRMEEAIATVTLALELDPLSRPINLNVARILHFARRYDEAVRQCLRTIEMYPDYGIALRRLGLSYAERGAFPEAIDSLTRATILDPEDSEALSGLGYAFALSGDFEKAARVERDLEALAARRFVSAYSFARVQIGLGDVDRAIESLERAFADRQGLMVYISVEPMFERIARDPRLISIADRMALPVG